jgi:hypothetical protein
MDKNFCLRFTQLDPQVGVLPLQGGQDCGQDIRRQRRNDPERQPAGERSAPKTGKIDQIVRRH